MIHVEKSHPPPESLGVEREKKSGSYRRPDVVSRLKEDFFNKCYLCELKGPTSVNIEHFKPHRGDKTLMFEWDNLFLSCAHCNQTKGGLEAEILNCTLEEEDVENAIELSFEPFPMKQIWIIPRQDSDKVRNTADLLSRIHYGETAIRALESENLRSMIFQELDNFSILLDRYSAEESIPGERARLKRRIVAELQADTAFTGFKRWMVRRSASLAKELTG